uniref:Endonuclease/exonuclease/phosphatase domain-containing protein n=1 Tax=Fundulus heteroclitus TaxID=8078 RepID=A0A3Q2SV30_FUNHE
MEGTIDLKLASWNVKGLNNVVKRKKISTYLKSSKVDTAYVRETHLTKSEAIKLKGSWIGKVFSSTGTIILCNIYAPNSDRPDFFHNLSQILLDSDGAQIIMAGDFNEIWDRDLDRSQLCSDNGLRDIWRLMHPDSRDYTRIDYFLISETIVNNSVDSSIGNIAISDHAPFFLCVKKISQTPKSRRWRLNEIQFFKESNKMGDTSLSTWWDALKAYLRGTIILYAALKKNNEKVTSLEAELKVLESLHQTKSRTTLNKIVNVKYNLNTLYTINAYWEMGEKPGRLLAYRLKQLNSMNHIPGVRQSGGTVTMSSQQINDRFRTFYNNLYSSQGKLDDQKFETFLDINTYTKCCLVHCFAKRGSET